MSVPFCQLAHPLLPGACSHAHSLQLWLYFCPVDRFIYNTTSRVHIYVSSMILFSPLIYSLRMTALSLSTSLYMIQFPLLLWLNNIPSYMHTTFLKFILNWRIIACQCCVAFCCTSTRIISIYLYLPSGFSLPPHSQSHPSRSSHSRELSSVGCTAAPH